MKTSQICQISEVHVEKFGISAAFVLARLSVLQRLANVTAGLTEGNAWFDCGANALMVDLTATHTLVSNSISKLTKEKAILKKRKETDYNFVYKLNCILAEPFDI